MDSNSVQVLTKSPDLVSGLMDVISAVIYAVATCFAGCAAIWGVRSWRRQFRGKRQIELAENTLELFYNARDAITAIRSILAYPGEGSTRQPEENETKEQKEARDKAYVAEERFKKHQEVFNKLHSMRYRFMAQIGKEQAEPFDEIHKIINEILVAARMLAYLWAPHRWQYSDEKKREKPLSQIEKYEAIFWWAGPEDDIGKQVEDVVKKIETICEPIIAGKTIKK